MKQHLRFASRTGRPSARRGGVRKAALACFLIATACSAAAECRFSISNPEIDYGALYRGELMSQGRAPMFSLSKRELTLTAVCTEATPFVMRFSGDAASTNSYRFATNGNFTIRLSNATVDGSRIDLARSAGAGGALSVPASSVMLTPGAAVAPMAGGHAVSGKVFSAQVEFETHIDEPSTRVRDVTVLQGGGAFELGAS
ncbi:hypothetical protein [Achromobacter spanius]|uniref:hypothetical protein n=1 Tax=Achromobacter spanius TaxID=217203 RepID=UPI00381BE93C